jgi:hypothetical protein
MTTSQKIQAALDADDLMSAIVAKHHLRALLAELTALTDQVRQQALSIISIDGQAQTMLDAIVAFCDVQQSAYQAWREQPHVAPLFEIARAAQEAAK